MLRAAVLAGVLGLRSAIAAPAARAKVPVKGRAPKEPRVLGDAQNARTRRPTATAATSREFTEDQLDPRLRPFVRALADLLVADLLRKPPGPE